MDYSKLVKALREHSKRDNCNCDTCFAYDAEMKGYTTCSEELTEKAADAIEELLRAAKKMHTWIFLNSYDEQEAYDECGLTDEMNAALGYGGRIEIALPKEETE